tara:strand:- start:106 stop:324 length:219 start_codon:yes stop_codon:yes gene_type:complete
MKIIIIMIIYKCHTHQMYHFQEVITIGGIMKKINIFTELIMKKRKRDKNYLKKFIDPTEVRNNIILTKLKVG